MPRAALRACRRCRQAFRGRSCPTCAPAFNRERGSAASRGYGHQHRLWREQVLARDPICRSCGRAPSTNADHVVPLARGGDWSLDNGQGLCASCHSRKTLREQHGRGG